jgi:hypothetical protein
MDKVYLNKTVVKHSKLFFSLLFLGYCLTSSSQTTIFTESLGTVASTTTIAAHETANGFDNDSYTMSSGGATNSADIRSTNASSGYSGASGSANIFFTTTNAQYGFAIEGIDASAFTSLTIDFAVRKEGASGTAFATFALDYWDGSAYQSVSLTGLPGSASAAGWYLISGISLPAAAQINGLKLRFTKSGTISCRLDDIVLKGVGAAPIINTNINVLNGFQYVFGSGPSPEQSFTCSGINLTSDITVSAPTNYEISTVSGSGFGTGLTLTQSSGSVSSTSIYVRLKAGLTSGSYNNELITLSSPGAVNKTITCNGDVLISGIYINEVFVDPADVNDGTNAPNTSEWIELYNSTTSPVDISCWFITDGDFAVTIPSITNIPAGGYFTIASATGSGLSPDLDWALCGCVSGASTQAGIFTNGGEQLILYDNTGTLIDAVIWGAGQLPGSMTTNNIGSCGSQSVAFPAAGSSYENIGTVSNGIVNERVYDGSGTWQQTSTGTFGATNGVNPLPIELIDFSGTTKGQTIQLLWTTATETNNDYFTIERSSDASNFESIINIKGAGNSSDIIHYNALDAQPFYGINYYRLKQTDFDGKYVYSGIISVNALQQSGNAIFPNPATTVLNIVFEKKDGEVLVELINLQGNTLLKKKSENPEDQKLTVDIKDIPPGTYILKTTSGKNTQQTLFIKQ